jgi:hypothetical protein
MNQHASLVITIVGISAEVVALIDHDAAKTSIGESLRSDEPREPCADDQEIDGRNSRHQSNLNAPIFRDLKFSLRCRPWSLVTFSQQNLSWEFGEIFVLAFMAQRIS